MTPHAYRAAVQAALGPGWSVAPDGQHPDRMWVSLATDWGRVAVWVSRRGEPAELAAWCREKVEGYRWSPPTT